MGDSLSHAVRATRGDRAASRSARRRWASPARAAASPEALRGAGARRGPRGAREPAVLEDRRVAGARALAVRQGAAVAATRATPRCLPVAPASKLACWHQEAASCRGSAASGRPWRSARRASTWRGSDGDPALLAYALSSSRSPTTASACSTGAEDCHAEAVALYEQAGDLAGLALSPRQPGEQLLPPRRFQAALEHGDRPLSLHSRIGNVRGIASSITTSEACFCSWARWTRPLEHLEEALRMRDTRSSIPSVAGIRVSSSLQGACLVAGTSRAREQALARDRDPEGA